MEGFHHFGLAWPRVQSKLLLPGVKCSNSRILLHPSMQSPTLSLLVLQALSVWISSRGASPFQKRFQSLFQMDLWKKQNVLCFCATLNRWESNSNYFEECSSVSKMHAMRGKKKHALYVACCDYSNCLQKCHLAFSSTCSITTRFCSTFTSSFMSVPPKIMPKGTWVSGAKVRQNKQKDLTLLEQTEANSWLYDYDTSWNDWRYEGRKTHHMKGKMFTQEKPPGPEKMNGQRSLKCMFLR